MGVFSACSLLLGSYGASLGAWRYEGAAPGVLAGPGLLGSWLLFCQGCGLVHALVLGPGLGAFSALIEGGGGVLSSPSLIICTSPCQTPCQWLNTRVCARLVPVVPLALSPCWRMGCPKVFSLWARSLVCSGIAGCRWSLCAHCYSPLGLLHCGCWVAGPQLSLRWSSWCSRDLSAHWMIEAQVSTMAASYPGGWGCGSPYPLFDTACKNLMNTSALMHTCLEAGTHRHALSWAAVSKNVVIVNLVLCDVQ